MLLENELRLESGLLDMSLRIKMSQTCFKNRPWWKEEEYSCLGSYLFYLIGLVVGFNSLGVSHTGEKIFDFFSDSAVGINR